MRQLLGSNSNSWRRTSTNRSCRSGRDQQLRSCTKMFTRRTTNTWCASTDASKTCRWQCLSADHFGHLPGLSRSRNCLRAGAQTRPRVVRPCSPSVITYPVAGTGVFLGWTLNGPGRSLHDALPAVPRNHPSSRQQQSQPRHSSRLRYSQHQPRANRHAFFIRGG